MTYVSTASREAFRPGSHDCALFAAGAVEAQTGVDLAAQWRGSYRTLEAGLKMLTEADIGDHVALAASYLPEVPAAFARVGDIAALADGNEMVLGVVAGADIWVLRLDGLGTMPLTSAARAFRV